MGDTHLSYWSKKTCNYTFVITLMPQKIMFLMGLTNIWECENRTFFHMWQSSLLLHIPFFVALHCFIFFEWMGWFRWITKQKMLRTTTNNNIPSSLIIRWPSYNTMPQYSRNAINVYMFFIIIDIYFPLIWKFGT